MPAIHPTAAAHPLRLAIIGTAARSDYLYGPIVQALSSEVELVSVWGRSADSARRLGTRLGVPWYTDLDRLLRETAPVLGIVSVAYSANGQVGLLAVEHGLHVLLETPIAHDLEEADQIIATAARHRLKIEVAEQFHRRPVEALTLRLLAAGLFGRVYSAFNDFAGHGYHGVSVLRSYLGFDAQPVQVTGAVGQYPLAPHWSRLAESRGAAESRAARTETQEHGIVTFADGRLGLFHWTDIGYDSALRWWRSSRFLAERGMGVTIGAGTGHEAQQHLTLLAPDGEAPLALTVERRLERNDGGALVALVAHTGDPATPQVVWENPLRPRVQGQGVQWHDDEIAVASCLLSLVQAVHEGGEPTYGPLQARLDQEIILALRRSAQEGSRPVRLPLER